MKIENKFYMYLVLIVCLTMSLICGGLLESVLRHDLDHENELIRQSLTSTGLLVAQDIQQNVANAIFVTDTLYALLENNNYDMDRFEDWAKQIFSSGVAVSAVQLAPDGVVQYIYPMKGNEGALGHDLLNDTSRDDGARKTVNSKEITFVGPVKLIQNDKYAVIARKPIFVGSGDEERFWGFTIALVLVDDFMPKEIKALEAQGLKMVLYGEDPDVEVNPVFYKSAHWSDSNSVSVKIVVPNGVWILDIGGKVVSHKSHFWFRLLGWIVSFLAFGVIFYQQYKMRNSQLEIIQLNTQLESDIEGKIAAALEKEKLIAELKKALDDVKTLSGLLPICARCKKIRDDDGYWNDLESYFEKHSGLMFSHGMCKDCADELYGDQAWYKKKHSKE